jgi:hypothetical protein
MLQCKNVSISFGGEGGRKYIQSVGWETCPKAEQQKGINLLQ